jgi:hypothetical protein
VVHASEADDECDGVVPACRDGEFEELAKIVTSSAYKASETVLASCNSSASRSTVESNRLEGDF